jgi:hypothetical protein
MKTLAHYSAQGKWAYNRAVIGVKKEVPVFCVLVIAGYIKDKNQPRNRNTSGRVVPSVESASLEHFVADSLNICNIGGELGDVATVKKLEREMVCSMRPAEWE